MRTHSHPQWTSDRTATREELFQVIELLKSIPAARDAAPAQAPGSELALARGEEPAEAKSLWVDRPEEDSSVQALDATLNAVEELLAGRDDLVN